MFTNSIRKNLDETTKKIEIYKERLQIQKKELKSAKLGLQSAEQNEEEMKKILNKMTSLKQSIDLITKNAFNLKQSTMNSAPETKTATNEMFNKMREIKQNLLSSQKFVSIVVSKKYNTKNK